MTWLPKVIAFVLFPAGRLRRVGFALGVIGCIAAVLGLAVLWNHVPPIFHLKEIVEVGPFIILWTKAILTSRRLHDIGLTGWLCFPGLFAFGFAAFARYTPDLYEALYKVIPGPATDISAWGSTIFAISIGLALVGDLILGFIPGHKGANAYGQPPGRSTASALEVF